MRTAAVFRASISVRRADIVLLSSWSTGSTLLHERSFGPTTPRAGPTGTGTSKHYTAALLCLLALVGFFGATNLRVRAGVVFTSVLLVADAASVAASSGVRFTVLL